MKRPSDDDAERSSSSDSKAEEFLTRFLRRNPRFFLYVAAGLGVLIVIGLIASKLSGPGH